MTVAAAPPPVQSPVAPVVPLQSPPVPVPSPAYHQPQVPPTPVYQPALQRRSGAYVPQTPHPVPYQVTPVPQQYSAAQASPYVPYQANRLPVPPPAVYNPNAPRPVEVFHLSDTANAAIPADIREQFHCDDQGHVLFFSSPPLDILPPVQQQLGHSLKYLAARDERRKRVEERKRKENDQREQREGNSKRIRTDEETALATRVETLTTKAVEIMASGILDGTNELYNALYKNRAEEVKRADAEALDRRILIDRLSREQTAQIRAHSMKTTFVNLKGNAVYMDDIDLTV